MAATRSASVTWNGDLTSGRGTVSTDSSASFENLPVSWAARTQQPDGQTSPEELLAAAHASCFAMAFSNELASAGTPPDELHVSAQVTFDQVEGGWAVTTSALQVLGRVPGCSESAFQAAAEAARDGCPISKALAGNVQLSVDATLEE
jgi:osmotically inducible protein OsmC